MDIVEEFKKYKVRGSVKAVGEIAGVTSRTVLRTISKEYQNKLVLRAMELYVKDRKDLIRKKASNYSYFNKVK